MELKLTLEKDDMLGSAIRELGSFSEMGECRCWWCHPFHPQCATTCRVVVCCAEKCTVTCAVKRSSDTSWVLCTICFTVCNM